MIRPPATVVVNPTYTFAEKQIVINLWHRTLQLQENGTLIKSYPIAPGSRDTPTPIGFFKIVNKSRNWGKGFGTRWMELNIPWGMYGIHGTNRPESVGKYVSHGCIRMKNKDIEDLFEPVNVGTQ